MFYAIGPGSLLISGVMEQNVIFHVMNKAGELKKRADHNVKEMK